MPVGRCHKVFRCPICGHVHKGVALDGIQRICDSCPHKIGCNDCPYRINCKKENPKNCENYYFNCSELQKDIDEEFIKEEEGLCKEEECFFKWFMYRAPSHLKI